MTTSVRGDVAETWRALVVPMIENGTVRQEDVAERLGVSQPAVSNWLSGAKTPQQRFLSAIRQMIADVRAGVWPREENGELQPGRVWIVLDRESQAALRRAEAMKIAEQAALERAVAARLAEENARDLRGKLSVGDATRDDEVGQAGRLILEEDRPAKGSTGGAAPPSPTAQPPGQEQKTPPHNDQ